MMKGSINMLKKIITVFLIIFFFSFSYIKTNGDNYINNNNNDEDSITIESLIPKRGEQTPYCRYLKFSSKDAVFSA